MVGGMNRGRRIAMLEQRKRARRTASIPLITAELDQNSDAAVARYVAKYGPLPEVGEEDVNVIVMVPVMPARRTA